MNAHTSVAPIKEAVAALTTAGHIAWQQHLLCGYSGNLSMRISPDQMLITAADSIKGFLQADDFLVVDSTGAILRGRKKPSSEMALHLAIYAAFCECQAILHTHPAHLQALELGQKSLDINLFEADFWVRRLVQVPDLPPGDSRLGQSCAKALQNNPAPLPRGAWLSRHGLCALGEDIRHCVAFSEELEHLAHVQLLTS